MDVFLAPSIYRAINPRTHLAIMAAAVNNPTSGRVIDETLWNDALIARSRSLLATKFITADYLQNADVMVMIDDDIVFEAADFWKIVEGARETRSIYGGAYVTRSTKPHIASRFLPGGEHHFANTPQRRPVEIQYLSTGFFAVHRDVVEAMVEARFEDADGGHRMRACQLGGNQEFWPFFGTFVIEEPDGRLHYPSEDWAFCNRARQLGFKIWCDESIILQHMGLYPYTVADLSRDDPGLPSTGCDRVEVEVEHPTGDPLLDTLIADLAEFCEEDEGDMRRMVALGAGPVQRLWSEKGTQSEHDFYRREDVGLAYMADLAAWHLRGHSQAGRMPVGAGKRWLEYGAGIGTLPLTAARAGADVVAYEPNQVMASFISWRADKHGISLTVCSEPGFSPRAFDVISCHHVFEHMERPWEALEGMCDWLRPGGVLFSESGYEDQSTPMHYPDPGWADILARHGFRKTGDALYAYEPARELVTP